MSKTTFKVRAKRWDIFNRECKIMTIRRDGFLNRTLPGEIALLTQIQPCDLEGERWLKKTWIERWDRKDHELKSVSLSLSDEVIEQMNTACAEKRVPRDAFMDCALAFFVQRLYEPAVVIKDLRTDKDALAQLAHVLNNSHYENNEDLEETDREVLAVVQTLLDNRNLDLLDTDLYQERLSFDTTRVDEERLMLEFDDLVAPNAKNNIEKKEKSA